MNIYLLFGGDPTRLQMVANIGSSIAGNKGFYEWFILATTRSSKNYVIRMGDGEYARYSHYFEIYNPTMPALPETLDAAPQNPSKTTVPTTTLKSEVNVNKLANTNGISDSNAGIVPGLWCILALISLIRLLV
ncbi:hypothetical protein K493DRAFT_301768 [Basidiobolus meristosporus CBS 931.73]|uniref:Uncharacterized protein n=1 Tax=Basidiobolus meristosporus CBS 931.73 TaxID=1314790 RepID=A0A1Y1YBA0_9FUNG|nr:hypothetical protein K493DRAFT_301768 [Basidiobolus meristosporus CBS 931.73]|eukprot:ORX94894.1 hypothetical protein K493DRAFT_301768 [Basidiobolus meristosporus CBS 931.73]